MGVYTEACSGLKLDAKNKSMVDIKNLGVKWNLSDPTLTKRICDSCVTKKRTFDNLEGVIFALICLFLSPYLIGYIIIISNRNFSLQASLDGVLAEECMVKNSKSAPLILSPPNNCGKICQGMNEVSTYEIGEMTRQEFLTYFAYSGRPVLIQNAAKNWPGNEIFNFDFFKQLFLPHYEAIPHSYSVQDMSKEKWRQVNDCQFLPFNTEFGSIFEFFNMSVARSSLQASQLGYLVAFNNCFRKKINLRQYLKTLPFLPINSESKQSDWILIGGTAAGHPPPESPIHIDEVFRPSWQAVLSGGYSWTLNPPAECESQCASTITVDMKPGDVLVVDTNIWQYQTMVKSGLSTVVYGSEFD